MKVREIAYNILCDVYQKHEYASLSMRNTDYGLSSNDQALLTQLVYGTLRNYRYLRQQWSIYVENLKDRNMSILLDMSVYQLFLLNKIPSYACVNEAVEIAKKYNSGVYAGLINAVLRKIVDKGPLRVNESDSLEKLAIETSHPSWLVKLWDAQYGKDICEKICWDNLQDGKVALRVNTLISSEQQLLKDEKFSKGNLKDCLYYDGNIIDTEYFTHNLVLIQSESSQAVVKLLDAQPKDKILDMCASPGTKSIQMAMNSNDKADIYSVDVSEKRVGLIDQALKRYEISSIRTICMDARNLPIKLPLKYFDKVLLDAPCSGLGTLKHKPEIKMNITPEKIDEIVLLQSQLLEAASLMVKDGGFLVYSTCTLNKKENERQISNFLQHHSDYKLLEEYTIFPYDSQSDGFYLSKLQRSVLE